MHTLLLVQDIPSWIYRNSTEVLNQMLESNLVKSEAIIPNLRYILYFYN